VVVSDKAVYAGFSAEKAEKSARFTGDQLKEIADWAKNIREFFNAQDPLYGAGNKDRAFVLCGWNATATPAWKVRNSSAVTRRG